MSQPQAQTEKQRAIAQMRLALANMENLPDQDVMRAIIKMASIADEVFRKHGKVMRVQSRI